MPDYDAIVLGAGAVGAATTYHLARRDHDVLLLDQAGIPNPKATSTGLSRLFRFAYHEGDQYVPLLHEAHAQWQTLDSHVDAQLFYETGSLAIGPPDSHTFTGARQTCHAHDLPHHVLDGAELTDRFPAFELSTDYRAVFQPDGGVLDPDACLAAFIEQAYSHGAAIHAYEPVTDWTAHDETVRVDTDQTTYTADELVVASGAWAADHVPEIAGLLTCERHVACRMQPRDPAQFHRSAFPVFVMDTVADQHFYGAPTPRVTGVKVGDTNTEMTGVDPATMDRQATRAETERVREFVAEYLPAGAGPALERVACVLTHTPDDDFIIDHHPDYPNVVVGIGLSGHGFKFAPVLGEMVADLVEQADPAFDGFRLTRFDRD